MVLLRDAPCRPGQRETPGSAQTFDGAEGEGENSGGSQYRAPDVLSGSGGSRQEENVYAALQRGQCYAPSLEVLSASRHRNNNKSPSCFDVVKS